jgi:hypothetical protein
MSGLDCAESVIDLELLRYQGRHIDPAPCKESQRLWPYSRGADRAADAQFFGLDQPELGGGLAAYVDSVIRDPSLEGDEFDGTCHYRGPTGHLEHDV